MNSSRTRSASLHTRLTLVFLFLTATLMGLMTAYWLMVLEPRLYADAKANAGVLAQSQSANLAEALLAAKHARALHPLTEAVDEILILTDPTTDTPFVVGLDIRVDYESLDVPPGLLDLTRGNTNCQKCFVTAVPLYSNPSRELLAIATYFSSNLFFERIQAEVRSRLWFGMSAALVILLLGWASVLILFRDLKASEEVASVAARVKSDFLATMSHEIRTPMNGILGMVRLLEGTPVNSLQREYIRAIDEAGGALLVILDDILDLSRIEAGKLNLEHTPFNLRELTENVVLLMSSRAEEKNLPIELDVDPHIPPLLLGDPVRLRQILLNLVSNAIKFTFAGSIRVSVNLRTAPIREHDMLQLQFEVHDTGIGISDSDQQSLFDAFTQADTTISRRFGGSGLGLAICKRLVQAMGGSIGVHSRPGEGSTFYFEISAAAAATRTGQPEVKPLPPGPVRPLRILIADDGEINRRVAKTLLAREGHDVAEVEDGQQAVEAVIAQDFDVVLMDLQMPGMDGLEATRRIRALADPDKAGIPIIAVTANILHEEKENCSAAGMNAFIAKPFDPKQLHEELGRVSPTMTSADETKAG